MKATIYLHLGSKNIKVLLENGEVWYWAIFTQQWKKSKHPAIDLVSKPWRYSKLSTVTNFKMKKPVHYEIW